MVDYMFEISLQSVVSSLKETWKTRLLKLGIYYHAYNNGSIIGCRVPFILQKLLNDF
jgi:hypothetical protein